MDIVQYSALGAPVTRLAYERKALQVIGDVVWSMGANKHYDVQGGASSFGVGPRGGALQLPQVFTPNGNWVNCYDLAATGQAWCASLGKRDTAPNGEPVS